GRGDELFWRGPAEGRHYNDRGEDPLKRLLIAVAVGCAALGVGHVPRAGAAVEDDLRDGDKYFEEGDWKKAATAYDRASAKGPGQVSEEGYGTRAAVLISLRDFKTGLEFVAKAKQRFPSAPEVLEQEALMLWEVDKREDAIKVAEQVVGARPQAFTNQKLIGE